MTAKARVDQLVDLTGQLIKDIASRWSELDSSDVDSVRIAAQALIAASYAALGK